MAKISRRSWPSMGHHHLPFVLLLVLLAVGICVPVFARLPSLSSTLSLPPRALHRDEKVSMILLICFSMSSCWLRDSAWFNSELKSIWKCLTVLCSFLSHDNET